MGNATGVMELIHNVSQETVPRGKHTIGDVGSKLSVGFGQSCRKFVQKG